MSTSSSPSRRPPARPLFAAGCLALVLVLGPPAVLAESPPPGDGDGAATAAAQEGDGGRQALDQAAAAKQEAYALEGAERESALLAAAERYGAVADDGEHLAEVRAEAAFRAGELLRARGRLAEAGQRFQQAVAVGEPSAVEGAREFAARGLLERAHAVRREGDVEAALALYGEVATRFPEQVRACAHAATWSGKLLVGESRLDEARPILTGFLADFPDYPLEAVRNVDLLAVAYAEAGDEETARALIDDLAQGLAPILADGGRMADQVRESLADLRVSVWLSGYQPLAAG